MAKKNNTGSLKKYDSELKKKERQLLLTKKKYLAQAKQEMPENSVNLRLLKKEYQKKCREYIDLWLKKRHAAI